MSKKIKANPAAATAAPAPASPAADAPAAAPTPTTEPTPTPATAPGEVPPANADDSIDLEGLAERLAKRRAPQPETVQGKPTVEGAAAEPEPEPEPAPGDEGAEGDGKSVPEEPPKEPADDGQETGDDEAATSAEEGADKAAPSKEPDPDALPANVQAAVDKRIGKAVAKQKAAEDLAQRLQQELVAAREAAEAAVYANNPAAKLASPEAVDQMEQQMRNLRRWCQKHADGGELPGPDGKPVERDAEEVGRMLETAEDYLEQHLPQQRRHLAKRQEYAGQVAAVIPWISNPESPERQEADAILAELPELRLRPHADFIAAVAVLGLKEYRRLEAAKKAPAKGNGQAAAPAKPPPKIVTKPVTRPAPARAAEDRELSEARQRFATERSTDALAERLAAQRRARELAAA